MSRSRCRDERLGAEVVWTRLLSLMLGATVYTFFVILGCSSWGWASAAVPVRTCRAGQPQHASLWLGVRCCWPWPLPGRVHAHPFPPLLAHQPSLSRGPGITFQIDLIRCLWAICRPPACGGQFPLGVGRAASRGQDPGRLVGGIYAANTVGAIFGSLAFSMLVIPPWAPNRPSDSSSRWPRPPRAGPGLVFPAT